MSICTAILSLLFSSFSGFDSVPGNFAKDPGKYSYKIILLLDEKPLSEVDSVIIQTNGQTGLKKITGLRAEYDTFRVELSPGTHHITFWAGNESRTDMVTYCTACPETYFVYTAGLGETDSVLPIIIQEPVPPESADLRDFRKAFAKGYSRHELRKLQSLKSNFTVRILLSPEGKVLESEIKGLNPNEQRSSALILKGIPGQKWSPAKRHGKRICYELYLNRNELLTDL